MLHLRPGIRLGIGHGLGSSDSGLQQQLLISQQVVVDSMRLLRSYTGPWNRRHEGIVYWAGIEQDTHCSILMALAPTARTSPNHYVTTPEANARAISTAREYGLAIVAQVHSHPGADVRHSVTDHKQAFMPFEGFYSVVVPFYATGEFNPLRCGWYRYEGGAFREKGADWVRQSVRLQPTSVDLRRGYHVQDG